jgi:DNA repair ATPase RecN
MTTEPLHKFIVKVRVNVQEYTCPAIDEAQVLVRDIRSDVKQLDPSSSFDEVRLAHIEQKLNAINLEPLRASNQKLRAALEQAYADNERLNNKVMDLQLILSQLYDNYKYESERVNELEKQLR